MTKVSATAPAVSPWLVLGAVFLASVAAVMAQFSAPPVMPLLMADFGIDIGQAGSLMSVFSIAGLVLALPAGLILQRFGPLVTGVAAVGSVIAGSVLGALAQDFSLFLASRAIQGVGIGLIGVAAPAVVAAAFPPERRGTPMGIWAMWMPVGGVLMYLLAPLLASSLGWRAAWWLSAATAAVALVVYVAVLRAASLGRPPAGGDALVELRRALGGRDIWGLTVVFGLFGLAFAGSNTFLPTFLVTERSFDLTGAATMSALVLLGAAIGSLLSGLVSDRIGSRRRVYTAASLLAAVLLLVLYNVDGVLLPVLLFSIGIMSGAIPSAIFSAIPEAVPEPGLAGAGMAGAMLGQNAGFVFGPMAFTAMLPALGWSAIAVPFAGALVIAAIIGWRVRVR